MQNNGFKLPVSNATATLDVDVGRNEVPRDPIPEKLRDIKDGKVEELAPHKASNRKGLQKVKTGCLTCRKRHVKCGEEKPHCLRCRKFGVYCEGYRKPVDKASTNASRSVVRPLIPKTRKQPEVARLLYELLPGTKFRDQREWRYFRHFCDDLADSLTGIIKTTLWHRSIPQASEMKPFVRDAAVALGALSISKSIPESQRDNSGQQMCVHEAYAIRQYVKALEGMREALADKTNDARQSLLACILVFCFETLQGHQASASMHASGGLDLIGRIDGGKSRDGQKHSGAVGPLTNGEEEDLYTAFTVLDIQTLLFIDVRTDATHRKFKEQMSRSIANMPTTFQDIQEAARFWNLILRRNCHFIACARVDVAASKSAREAQSPPTEDNEEDISPLRPGNNPWSSAPTDPIDIPPDLREEHRCCFDDIKRFKKAANPVIPQCSAQSDEKAYVTSLIIRIQMAMNTIQLLYCFFPEPIEWDKYLPTFRTIITLVPVVLPYIKKRPPSSSNNNNSSSATRKDLLFRFEIGIIPALSVTTNLCRAQPERDQALELLRELGEYREGIWDRTTTYGVAKWLRDVEEKWRDENGVVPACRRVRFEGAEINIRRKRMIVRGWQGDGTERGVVLIQDVVKW